MGGLGKHDAEGDVSEALGHHIAQGEGFASTTLSEQTHGRMKGKVLQIHLKLADWPEWSVNGIDHSKRSLGRNLVISSSHSEIVNLIAA